MAGDAQHWQDRLDLLADKYGVPGALLGILRPTAEGTEVVEAAHGVLNKDTGVSATSDSLFQIGSISKVWTATLVMQLVDEGKLDLDAPVVNYLPDFRVADADVTRTVTTRHLLAHSSGIDGDLFLDTGRGDDCVEKYVAACGDLKQNHPLGETMSYCNSGYVVLGRLVEVLRESTWDAALRTHLSAPLGLTHTHTLPEEALRFGAAAGHVTPPGAELMVAPVWSIVRSMGPAGLICSTPKEVLAFAQMHLSGGLATDGTRVLSEASAAVMREAQIEVPDKYTLGSHWGLGWILFDWDGKKVFGHDGTTIGQNGFLRIVPESGVAVCLLSNGGQARDLYQALFSEVLEEEAGVRMPTTPSPSGAGLPAGIGRYVGHYSRVGLEADVTETDGRLSLVLAPSGPNAQAEQPPTVLELQPFEDEVFVTKMPGSEGWMPITFFTLPNGSQLVHFGARATPKVG